MMKEEVIVKRLYIDNIGEKQFFQISLPRDTKKIIGLEYGATAKDGVLLPTPSVPLDGEEGDDDISLSMTSNKVVGKLVLKTALCSGIFYQGDIVEDQNPHFGENIAAALWTPYAWTHGRKRHEVELSVDENRLIHGFFEDSWGIEEYQTLSYILHIYVWIEKCTR